MLKICNLLIIFIVFIAISCSDSNNNPKTEDLCKNKECGESYSCNKTTGECERIEDYCTNDTMCDKETEVCDKIHKRCVKKLEKNFCEKHEECETWEVCNFNTYKCEPREGMCNEDENCTSPPYLKCNTRVHKCTNPDSCLYNFCNEWEICKEDEKCYLREGFCINDNDCTEQFPYDSCNLETHSCQRPIITCTSYTQCNQNYQYCDTNESICKASLGKCRSNLDCIENSENGNKTVCNKETNNCITPENQNCKITGCNYWQICNEDIGTCKLPQNRCNDNNDCTGIREICNQAHYCEVDDCTTHGCDWWKHCIRDTGECKLYDAMCDTSTDCTEYTPYTNCSLIHTCSKPLGQ